MRYLPISMVPGGTWYGAGVYAPCVRPQTGQVSPGWTRLMQYGQYSLAEGMPPPGFSVITAIHLPGPEIHPESVYNRPPNVASWNGCTSGAPPP